MWPLTLITVIFVTEISLHITVETGGTYSPIRYSVHCSQRIIIRTIRYLAPPDNSLHCMWCSYNLVLFVAFTLCLWINYHHIFCVSRNFLIIITYLMQFCEYFKLFNTYSLYFYELFHVLFFTIHELWIHRIHLHHVLIVGIYSLTTLADFLCLGTDLAKLCLCQFFVLLF